MADLGEGLEEPYANLLALVEEQTPDSDFYALERGLTEDPDAMRQAAVGGVLAER